MEDRRHLWFTGTVLFIHLAYVAIYFGIIFIDEIYLRNFSTLVQLGVCLFLIYRFSPWQKLDVLTHFDRSIIFYCATFLLLNVVSIEVYRAFVIPVLRPFHIELQKV